MTRDRGALFRHWLARGLGGVTLFVLAGCAASPPGPMSDICYPPNGPVRPTLASKWRTAAGLICWPLDDGFAAPRQQVTLPPGTLLDRYGADNGRFLSFAGESYSARSLPYVCAAQPYSLFKVVRPLAVEIGQASPWFDDSGGAIQVQTSKTVGDLLKEKPSPLAKIPPVTPPSCGSD
jgi:hypothetical protein